MRSIIIDQMKMNDIGGAYDTVRGGGGGEKKKRGGIGEKKEGGPVGKKKGGGGEKINWI